MPPEAWAAGGVAPAWAALLAARRGWSAAQAALAGDGFRRYVARAGALVRRDPWWPPPRRRHLVVAADADAVRPWAQLLGTTAWLVYADDLDPARASPAWLAWLLALGDRMALTGEATMAAVQAAAWWADASDAECAEVAAAARRVRRPDAAALVATADALPWLRRLRHETLAPPAADALPHRPIPGTGLLVPPGLDAEPPALVTRWHDAAEAALHGWRGRWRGPDAGAVDALCAWLATVPPLLVTVRDRPVWDPAAPGDVGALRAALADADGVAVRAVHEDLQVVADHTRRFRAALRDPDALPRHAGDVDRGARGYAHLHAERGLVAYDLAEEGMERLHGPPLPWGRAMLGARTAHEWGHLADAAGLVVRTVDDAAWARRRGALAALLDDVVVAAPDAIRRATADDLAALARDAPTPGAALADVALARLPDWRANVVARRFLSDVEAEVYARHNVRAVRHEYPPAARWRLLVRLLYEGLYVRPALGFARVEDPRAYVWTSTWAFDDVVRTGMVDAARWDALSAALEACCTPWVPDPARLWA